MRQGEKLIANIINILSFCTNIILRPTYIGGIYSTPPCLTYHATQDNHKDRLGTERGEVVQYYTTIDYHRGRRV